MIYFQQHPGILQFNSLSAFQNIAHFATTRLGGCSQGAFESFNLSEYSGDEISHVSENRKTLCKLMQLNPANLFVPCQTHSSEIITIDEAFIQDAPSVQKEKLKEKDALITNIPEICIGITTADCVPILLYATDKQVIGAVHAGWRGTQQRIVHKTILQMIKQFGCHPENIHAAIGPSISARSFEVGDEVFQAFENTGFDMPFIAYKHHLTKKYHIDLWEANRLQLREIQIPENQIEISGICTYLNDKQFFSARKSGIQSGRMLTGICIR